MMMTPSSSALRDLPVRNPYWLVVSCELCGRRVRASHALRYWKARTAPTLDDAEVMATSSRGHGRIQNERSNLWTQLAATMDYNKRYELRTAVATYFEQLEQRLLAAARVARQAAGRARYGR
ncbi:MAG: hypothetical protein U0234_05290 [Sandaracinus sp.]